MMWWAILAAAAGCFAFKIAGLSVPARFLDNAKVRAVAALLPVALLAALIVSQTFTSSDGFVVDTRAAGLAAALVAVLLRAPFLVVVGVAALTTALIRALL